MNFLNCLSALSPSDPDNHLALTSSPKQPERRSKQTLGFDDTIDGSRHDANFVNLYFKGHLSISFLHIVIKTRRQSFRKHKISLSDKFFLTESIAAFTE